MPTATSIRPAPDAREAPATRERILRGAFELIGREGIGAISNRRLAAAAGVSLGSLTYHFPSQEELLRECLLIYVEEEVGRLEAIAAELRSRRPPPSRMQVAAEVQRIASESIDRPEHVAELELHLRASRQPALQEASRRCFAAYEGLAAAALEALGVPAASRHAGAVVAVITGMGVRQLGAGRHDVEGLADALRAIVTGALAEAAGGSERSPSNTVDSMTHDDRRRKS
ncbi:MAG TPA: TetR family transcriptional regulator [Solirubrobacterales bacterium]|nr:TetR family transcriptional regulator [Solirubrobacterales bacterium]